MIEKENTYMIFTPDGKKTKARVVEVKAKGRGHTVTYKADGEQHSVSMREFQKMEALAA